jgi:undecaprenyl-diphosphatase
VRRSANVLDLIVLALVQGLTEFLPVSSTAHLLIAEHYLDVRRSGLVIEAVLHLGTVVATILMFRHDVGRLLLAVPRLLRRGTPSDPESDADRRLLAAIAVATAVTGVLGLVFLGPLERTFDSVRNTAFYLMITGFVLLAHRERGQRTGGEATLRDGLLLGAAQALAIIPGISRSGMTIITGLLLGFRRAEAARVSFLMAIPAILGAGLFGLKDAEAAAGAGYSTAGLVVAGIVAGIAGAIAIAWLLDIVRKQRLTWFSVYCWVAALIVLATVR